MFRTDAAFAPTLMNQPAARKIGIVEPHFGERLFGYKFCLTEKRGPLPRGQLSG